MPKFVFYQIKAFQFGSAFNTAFKMTLSMPEHHGFGDRKKREAAKKCTTLTVMDQTNCL